MSRAIPLGRLLCLLALAQWGESVALKPESAPMLGPMQIELPAPTYTVPQGTWKYFPPGVRFGIVTGGNLSLYERANWGSKTASIMLKYAKRHGYAFAVEKNILRFADRPKYWNKIKVMQDLIQDVPMLVWMDPEVVITNPDITLETLLNGTANNCGNLHQRQWDGSVNGKVTPDTWLWMSGSSSPARYKVNADTAVMFVKRGEQATNFLRTVWAIGNDPLCFMRHDDPNRYKKRVKTATDYGWPWEQGAVWDLFAANPQLLHDVCFAHQNHFHSGSHWRWGPDQFAQRIQSVPEDYLKNKVAATFLEKMGGHAEIK